MVILPVALSFSVKGVKGVLPVPWHSPMFPPRAVLFGCPKGAVVWGEGEPKPPPVEAPNKVVPRLPAVLFEEPKVVGLEAAPNKPPPDALLLLLLLPKPPNPPEVPAVAVPLPKRPVPAELVVEPKPLARF